jgi:putative ABC transport system permease protein
VLRGAVLDDAVLGASFVDGRVLAATAAVTIGAGLLVSLVPALSARRIDVASALKAGARGGANQRSTLRAALLVMQAALSLVLLASAGLFVRSLERVRALDIGMDARGVLLTTVDLAGDDRKAEQALFEGALERVRGLPGVEHAALAATVPFWSNEGATVIVPGARDSMPQLGGDFPTYNAVTPDFFATMRTPVLRGRAFQASDGATSPPVVLVNETFARHVWPAGDAIGRCVRFGEDRACRTVIGVVAPARRGSLFESPTLQLYVPLVQSGMTAHALFVRTAGDPSAMVPAVRRALAEVSATVPYADVRPFASFVDGQIRPWTLGASVMSAFGLLAVVVAAVGLYSLLAYGVEQRQHEIAVRLALGATAGMVLRFTVAGALRLIAAGVGIGLVAAMGMGGLLGPLLFETRPRDPVVLGTVAAVLGLVGLVGSAVPAWRASRIDAGVVLRGE